MSAEEVAGESRFYRGPSACLNAARNASGCWAPDTVTFPLTMKNGTPSTEIRPSQFDGLLDRFLPLGAVQHVLVLRPGPPSDQL
jgi:hypothetical protein